MTPVSSPWWEGVGPGQALTREDKATPLAQGTPRMDNAHGPGGTCSPVSFHCPWGLAQPFMSR